MKKITLNLYNNGIKTKIADFKNCSMEAVICMKSLNDREIFSHGKLPENIFYYLQYSNRTSNNHIFVDYTDSQLYPNDAAYMAKIDGMANKLQLS